MKCFFSVFGFCRGEVNLMAISRNETSRLGFQFGIIAVDNGSESGKVGRSTQFAQFIRMRTEVLMEYLHHQFNASPSQRHVFSVEFSPSKQRYHNQVQH